MGPGCKEVIGTRHQYTLFIPCLASCDPGRGSDSLAHRVDGETEAGVIIAPKGREKRGDDDRQAICLSSTHVPSLL